MGCWVGGEGGCHVVNAKVASGFRGQTVIEIEQLFVRIDILAQRKVSLDVTRRLGNAGYHQLGTVVGNALRRQWLLCLYNSENRCTPTIIAQWKVIVNPKVIVNLGPIRSLEFGRFWLPVATFCRYRGRLEIQSHTLKP